MRFRYLLATALLATAAAPAFAQSGTLSGSAPELGEVLVSSNRQNAPFAQQERPVIGVRRQADSVVSYIAFTSDSRDALTREREIHTMMLAAIDRAGAAGIELVSGSFVLQPVTKANYLTLPMMNAGRIDTSKVDVMVKAKLTGSTAAAIDRFNAFSKTLPRSGRGTVDFLGALNLTIINPDQYRDAIIKLVAEDARKQAAVFGPDYAVQASGIDGQVGWSQISPTEVFLTLPYHYTIIPK